MQKKIIETTATYPLGLATGSKLLKVTSGQYSTRLVAVIQTTAGEIKYSWADRPYVSWSTPVTIASDAADQPCDSVIESDGDVHVIYTESSTSLLVTKKLTFSGGGWTVGSRVTIYNGTGAYFPSVTVEAEGKLWVSWSHLNLGSYYLHVKSSSDGGATWGSGPSDAGDEISNAASSLFSKTVVGLSDVFVVYSHDDSTLSVRSIPVAGGSWTDAVDLASSSGDFDEHFDAAVSDSGLVAVAYDQGAMKYREYDGAVWGPVIALDSGEGQSVQLLFKANVPVVVYLSQFASGQQRLMYTSRQTGSFGAPAPLDGGADTFDDVLVYDTASSTYNDLSVAAASATPADVFHASSSTLMKELGDAVYLGMDRKFRYLRVLLSTSGVGGSVNYSYWNGSAWVAFTPAAGLYHFNTSDRELLLWNDYDSTPADWQKKAFETSERYWIRIQVAVAFTTGPVGSQITSISDLKALSVRR